MKFTDAVEIIKDEANKVNSNIKSDLYIRVYAGQEHLDIPLQERPGFDYRLYDERYTEHAVSYEISSRRNKRKLGHATYYILPREVYTTIFFWKRLPDEGVLKKTFISQVEGDLGDTIINMAFGILFIGEDQANDVVYRAASIKLYIDIYKRLTEDTYVLAEPTGLYRYNAKLNEMDILNEEDIGGFDRIGMVFGESKPAYRLIKYLGFELVPDIYHHISLGPIYHKMP
jgi:hypothetical protein